MTKRKRDVFTVIESINNWFEASENSTTPTTDLEEKPRCFEHIRSSRSEVTVTNWAAASTEAVGGSVPWEEAGHVALSRAELETRFEVARESTTYPADRSWVFEGTWARTQERPAVAGEPGGTGGDIRSRPHLGTEVVGEEDDTLTTFWDVLRAAGYDVWG